MTQPVDPVPAPDARLQGAEQPPVPQLGHRYTHRPGLDARVVTVTGLKEAADGPLVTYEWRDNGPGALRGCVPLDVFHRVYEPEQPAADTLPEWLCQRYRRYAFPFDNRTWDQLPGEDRSYWAHEAAAVRRAVGRGGFKAAGGEV